MSNTKNSTVIKTVIGVVGYFSLFALMFNELFPCSPVQPV